jgi:ABC-type glycerol-3-phosphate transport system substrate-binding protein
MFKLTRLLRAAACALGLWGAAAQADTITFWVNAPMVPNASSPVYEEVRAFEARTGHKVNVQAIPFQELEQRLFVALGGGAGPDVMAIDTAWMAAFADAGVLADLTERTRPAASQYQPGPLASGRYQGRQYALPWYTNNVALFVNNDMLKAAGYAAPPKNWAEFRAVAKAMRALGPDRFGLSMGAGRFGVFQMTAFIWQNGGELIDDSGKVRVGEPAVAETFALFTDMYRVDKSIPDTVLTAQSWDEVFAPFIQGRAGMLISGDWTIGAIRRGAPNLNYTIAPLPVGVRAATVIGGFNLAVNAKSKSPAAAAELALHLTGPRSVEAMRKADRLSAQASAATPDALAKLPENQRPFMAQAPVGRPRPNVPIWAEVHSSILSPAWDASLRGVLTPQAAVQKAAAEINAKMK